MDSIVDGQRTTENKSRNTMGNPQGETQSGKMIMMQHSFETDTNTGVVLQPTEERKINYNKPWREIIRRKIDYGRSNNENIS